MFVKIRNLTNGKEIQEAQQYNQFVEQNNGNPDATPLEKREVPESIIDETEVLLNDAGLTRALITPSGAIEIVHNGTCYYISYNTEVFNRIIKILAPATALSKVSRPQ